MPNILKSISGIFFFTATIVHIWTVVIAFQQSGLLSAIISLFLPVLGEIYWMFSMWGAASSYAQLALVHLVLAMLFSVYGIKKK